MSTFELFVEVLFIFIGQKETHGGQFCSTWDCDASFPPMEQEEICNVAQMSSGVSASLSSCCLYVEGRSLGEMKYHYVAGASNRDFSKVININFWFHDGYDMDEKTLAGTLRNLSVNRCKGITKLFAGQSEVFNRY